MTGHGGGVVLVRRSGGEGWWGGGDGEGWWKGRMGGEEGGFGWRKGEGEGVVASEEKVWMLEMGGWRWGKLDGGCVRYG